MTRDLDYEATQRERAAKRKLERTEFSCATCDMGKDVERLCHERRRWMLRATPDPTDARALRMWLSDVEYAALSRRALEMLWSGDRWPRCDIHALRNDDLGLRRDIVVAHHCVTTSLYFEGMRVLCPTVHAYLVANQEPT